MKTNTFNYVFAGIIVLILAASGIYFYSILPKETPVDPGIVALAKCLADKKVTMYGSRTCSHCLREKSNFGNAFKYVPYVECLDNIQACEAKKVNAFPTWIIGDAKMGDSATTSHEGELGLVGLAQLSGCPLVLTTTTGALVASSSSQQ